MLRLQAASNPVTKLSLDNDVIRFEQVKKIYQMGNNSFAALKGINFSIKQGELVAIVGPSGSGKSTTMHILGLLDQPTSGKYFLDDIDTSEFSIDQLATLRNQRLGFIFQHFFLLPKLTALENVMLPLTYRHTETMLKKDMETCALEMLEKVNVAQFASHRPNELSGGQQQRVAIARALIGNPSIILADEPTGALDSKTSTQIMTLLTEGVAALGKTVVVITHSSEIANCCHRQIHIHDGMIEAR